MIYVVIVVYLLLAWSSYSYLTEVENKNIESVVAVIITWIIVSGISAWLVS